MRHKVAIGAYQQLEDVLNKIGSLEKFIRSGDHVFIKPNLCAPKSHETGTTTNPYLIEELIKLLKPITCNITIGDGPIPVFGKLSADGHPLLYSIAKKHGIEIIDLNHGDLEVSGSFVLSKTVLEADVVINMPVLKTHVRTGLTCSLKNMMGVVPLRLKHEMHKQGLDRRIVELAKTIKPDLNIVDATTCQEKDGPTNGTAKELGLVIAGDNQVAVDALCCKIIGINPRSIPHLKLADQENVGSIRDIELVGFERKYISRFELPWMYKNIFTRLAMQVAEGPIIRCFERNNGILIDKDKCVKCNLCVKVCPVRALTMAEEAPVVDSESCILCLCCHETCLNGAISIRKKGISQSGVIGEHM